MAKVIGTHGNAVDIQVLGLNETLIKLASAKKMIKKGADFGVVRAGTFVTEEVKESAMGHRAETKSVDTGLFANSIEFKKTGDAVGIVEPKEKTYPGTNTTTKDVATILEFGTSRLAPRRHFRNTKARNEKKVKEIINKEIKGFI